ncbi:MAG: FAD-linked oxidoreductase [Caulobacteraceae bacterium]|nr:FAD-linked oxidoreductase [Caulobacteraceae bacterium]
MAGWRNWSGSVTAQPAAIERPRTLVELQALVAGAGRVRVTGAGHSFMPLCETDGLLLNLSDMEGEITVCDDGGSAWVPGGWPIERLTPALWARGLSLANQGDIDKQAIAGALSTGTHGTGVTLGSISTQATAFRLVMADGSLAECDGETDPDLFQAARLGLGMVGVIERVKLALEPAYRLKETLRRAPLEEILGDWDALTADHRHIEFFIFPYAEQALMKILDPVETGDDTPAVDLGNGVLQLISDVAAAAPFLAPPLQRLITRLMGASTRAAPAYRIFPSERTTLFEEMEYEIPAAAGPDALRAAVAEIRRRRFPIIFPLEFRTVAADDIWLSPMHAGPCVSISFHQYARMDWRTPFAAMEPIFAAAGGRPHWAKRHSLTSDDVQRLYPMAQRWGEVRKRVDPAAKFMNASLRDLFAFSL